MINPFSTDSDSRDLGVAEGAAHTTTLAAIVLTFLLSFGTVELNPVAARLFDVLGYPATAGLAMLSVSLAFALFRRVSAPHSRIGRAGGWALASVGLLDVTVNLWQLSAVGFPESTNWVMVSEIVAAGAVGVLVIHATQRYGDRLREMNLSDRLPAVGRTVGKQAATVCLVAILVLAPVTGFVAFSGVSSPVGTASAASDWSGEVVYSASYDQTVKAHYAHNGSEMWSASPHTANVEHVSVSESLDMVFSASNDGTMAAYDPTNGSVLWTKNLGGTADAIPEDIALSPGGKTLYAAGNGTSDTYNRTYAYHAENASLKWKSTVIDSGPEYLAIHPGGDIFAVDTNQHTTTNPPLYRISPSGTEVFNNTNEKGHGGVYHMEVTGNGDYIITGNKGYYTANGSKWDGKWNSVGALEPSDSGDTYHAGNGSGDVGVYDRVNKTWKWSTRTHDDTQNIRDVEVGDFGTTIYSGSYDTNNNLAATDVNGTVKWVSSSHTDAVADVALMPGDPPTVFSTTVRVTDEDGDPIENARVSAFGVDYTNFSNALSESEKHEKANEEVQISSSDVEPKAWYDQADIDESREVFMGDGDQDYVTVYNESTASPTAGGIFNDKAALKEPVAEFDEGEKIIATVWAPDRESYVETGFDRQLPGGVKKDDKIVFRKVDGNGEYIDSKVVNISEDLSGNIVGVPTQTSTLNYAETRLSAGYWEVRPASGGHNYLIKVGDVGQMIANARNHTKPDAPVTDKAKSLREKLNSGNFTRIKGYTNQSGYLTLNITDASVKTIGIQASKLSSENMSQIDEQITATDAVGQLSEEHNISVNKTTKERQRLYKTSEVRRVTFPFSDGPVEIQLEPHYWPSSANVSGFDEEMDKWRGMMLDDYKSSINATVTENYDEFQDLQNSTKNRTELENLYERLHNLTQENQELKDKYRNLSQRYEERLENGTLGNINGTNTTSTNETVTINPNVTNATNQTLRDRIGALEEAIQLMHSDVNTDASSETNGDGTVDATFQLSESAEKEDIVVFANTEGSRELVSDEYLTVEQTGVGGIGSGTVVEISGYPVNSSDNSMVTFTARAMTDEGLAKNQTSTKNPAVSADVPSFDSVRLSEKYPSPNSNVTVEIKPGNSATFGSLANARLLHPNGTDLGGSVNGTEATFQVDDPGIYIAEVDITPAGSTTEFTESFRIRVADARTAPATIRPTKGKTGTFAVTANGIDRAEVAQSGDTIDVTAYAAQGAPDDIHVYTRGLTQQPDATTSVTVLEADGQSARSRSRVHIHAPSLSDDAVMYRVADGDLQPLKVDGETQWGKVEKRNGGMLIRTATTERGTVTIKTINDPGVVDRAMYRVRLTLGPLPSSPLSLGTGLGLQSGPSGAVPAATAIGFITVFAYRKRRH